MKLTSLVDCRVRLLPLLRRSRDPLQFSHEALPPIHLDSLHHGRLGHRYLPYGRCPQLWRPPRRAHGSGVRRGWIVPRHHLLVSKLVKEEEWSSFTNKWTKYSITMWYKRHECGLRMAIFFSAATAAGAFGGLFARGIMEMSGAGGLKGWAWIFIIEGLATFVFGMLYLPLMS